MDITFKDISYYQANLLMALKCILDNEKWDDAWIGAEYFGEVLDELIEYTDEVQSFYDDCTGEEPSLVVGRFFKFCETARNKDNK